MRLFGFLKGSKEEPQLVTFAEIAKGKGYTFRLVGESHFQDQLDAICGGKCEQGHNRKCTAQLFFLTDNQHDPDAIAVMIDGRPVGYVPRVEAAQMRADLTLANPSLHPTLCSAKIVGGWIREDGDEGHYGVKLSVSRPIRVNLVDRRP